MGKNSGGERTAEIVWNPGEANPKQREFFGSRTLYTAYGGAKGGGKTWAVRVKAVGGALRYPGIRILIMRKTYPELTENHIRPVLAMLPKEAAKYSSAGHYLEFLNGSYLKFGHWQGEMSEREYQGQEFDWIFIDEATQFSERAFNFLGGCLRGVSRVPRRMYLTCNPGGIGHNWVKRLFIDRDYREGERPEDYSFIPATVEDNRFLMEASPNYIQLLNAMPEDLRRAYRYGDWDALGGNYFSELQESVHRVDDFPLPAHWPRYRAIDYGLDMLACVWAAVDEKGRSYIYRELKMPGLIVSEAAREIVRRTPNGEAITATFAPPDLWSRQKDTGRTMEELFAANGVPLVKADNDRVAGHLMIKDALSLDSEGKAKLRFFRSCQKTYADLAAIRADSDNPSDCAKEPHGVTHAVDAVRYYCVQRKTAAQQFTEEEKDEYMEFMVGGT